MSLLNIPRAEPFSATELIPGTTVPFSLELPPELKAIVSLIQSEKDGGLATWKFSVSEAMPPDPDERRFQAHHVDGSAVNPLDVTHHVLWVSVKQRSRKPPLLTLTTFHHQDQFLIDSKAYTLRPRRNKRSWQPRGSVHSSENDVRSFTSARITSVCVRFDPYDAELYPDATPVTIEITQRPKRRPVRPGNKIRNRRHSARRRR